MRNGESACAAQGLGVKWIEGALQAALDHLDRQPGAQPQFLQTMHLVRITDNLDHFAGLAGGQGT